MSVFIIVINVSAGFVVKFVTFFDAADTEAENKKEQQIAIRIAEIENTFNFFIEHLRSL